MAAEEADSVAFDSVTVEGMLFDIKPKKNRSQPDPGRRAAHRRT
jgi:hypothetical protein